MNTSVLDRKSLSRTTAPTPNPPKGNDLLEAIALALEARGTEKTAGFEGIEHRGAKEVLAASSKDTVFGWIAEELTTLGVVGDMTTVGGTLAAMGIVGDNRNGKVISDHTARHHAAHAVGCHCHGLEITAEDAAKRVRGLKSST